MYLYSILINKRLKTSLYNNMKYHIEYIITLSVDPKIPQKQMNLR